MGIKAKLPNGAIKEEGGDFLSTFPHLRDAYLFDNAHDFVFVIKIQLQGVQVVVVRLQPKADVRNVGKSPGVRVYRVGLIWQLKEGDGLPSVAGDVALARALDDQEWEGLAGGGVEAEPIPCGWGQWPAPEGCAVSGLHLSLKKAPAGLFIFPEEAMSCLSFRPCEATSLALVPDILDFPQATCMERRCSVDCEGSR